MLCHSAFLLTVKRAIKHMLRFYRPITICCKRPTLPRQAEDSAPRPGCSVGKVNGDAFADQSPSNMAQARPLRIALIILLVLSAARAGNTEPGARDAPQSEVGTGLPRRLGAWKQGGTSAQRSCLPTARTAAAPSACACLRQSVHRAGRGAVRASENNRGNSSHQSSQRNC